MNIKPVRQLNWLFSLIIFCGILLASFKLDACLYRGKLPNAVQIKNELVVLKKAITCALEKALCTPVSQPPKGQAGCGFTSARIGMSAGNEFNYRLSSYLEKYIPPASLVIISFLNKSNISHQSSEDELAV